MVVRHVGVEIARPAAEVVAYVRDPRNLPRWAAGLAAGVGRDETGWYAESPMGRVRLAFCADNELGVCDHDVTLPDGTVVTNPLRVIADGDRCQVVFTVRGQEIDGDVAAVTADLARLLRVLTDRGATARRPVGSAPLATLDTQDPLAVAVVRAIRTGDLAALRTLLAANPGLAAARLGDDDADGMSRTLLHVVTDWPGHVPRGAETVAALVAAGADVGARFRGPHGETPLHWAASSDDVAVLDALLDAGADIEAPGAVIAGGPPLADATAFGQWAAARRLVERGARTGPGADASLGLLDNVRAHFGRPAARGADEIGDAFWQACHGGQIEVASYLLDRGADVNWIPGWEPLTPLDIAARSGAHAMLTWLYARGGRTSAELRGD